MAFFRRIFLSAAAIVIFTAGGTTALNWRIERQKARLHVRQISDGQYNGPTNFQLVQMLPVGPGTEIEECNIDLTPETDSEGGNVVQASASCSTTYVPTHTEDGAQASDSDSGSDASSQTADDAANEIFNLNSTTVPGGPAPAANGGPPAGPGPASIASGGASATTTSSAGNPTIAPVSVIQAGNNTDSANDGAEISSSDTPTTSSAVAAATSVPPVSVLGTTLVSDSIPVSTPTTSTPVTSSAAPTTQITATTTSALPTIAPDNAVVTSSAASVASSSVSSNPAVVESDLAGSSAPSATAAFAAAAAVQLPGTKVEVLPIGLGVFGGITAIALIVIGYVMWERTKYRKNFRERKKLADQAATVGYGGMAQRV